MRLFLALVIILLAAVFFAYPPLLEGSSGECSALEERVADLASHDASGRLVVGALYGSGSSSPGGAVFARDRYPALPAEAGCAIAYWKSMFDPAASVLAGSAQASTAPRSPSHSASPSSPSETEPPVETGPASRDVASVVARSITPNGDPISPATAFTLPMPGVAVRVDYPGGKTDAVRFLLLQGKAVLSSCAAQKGAPGIAWCKFNMSLRKGVYSIAVTANNAPLGRVPFTVIGN